MKFKQVNEGFEEEIKELLKKKKIKFEDFKDYGYVVWDYINNISYIKLGKYNGIYDYEIGKVEGNAEVGQWF